MAGCFFCMRIHSTFHGRDTSHTDGGSYLSYVAIHRCARGLTAHELERVAVAELVPEGDTHAVLS